MGSGNALILVGHGPCRARVLFCSSDSLSRSPNPVRSPQEYQSIPTVKSSRVLQNLDRIAAQFNIDCVGEA